MKEQLREARQKHQVKFMEFTRLYKRDKFAMFCFFEGEDDSDYYRSRIEAIAAPKFHFFVCDGKASVLRLHNIIVARNSYAKARTAYFIDRDFDPPLHQGSDRQRYARVYETPCYAIENFYTSIECVKKILASKFKLFELGEEFEKCVELYENLQQQFHQAIADLNAWLAIQKRGGIRINWQQLKFEVELDEIRAKYTLDELASKFPDAKSVSREECDRLLAEWRRDRSDRETFRGKYEIEFLCKFLRKLAEGANKGNSPYFAQKIKVTLNPSPATLVSDLCQYADTPDCLWRYLNSFQDASCYSQPTTLP